jgi:hypothetical protein
MSKTADQPTAQGSTAPEPTSERELQGEIERLRARLAALESELVEVQSRADAAVGHWQERAYWLERWHLDLNRAMRRPGAMQLLGALRLVRGVWWRAKRLKRRLLDS